MIHFDRIFLFFFFSLFYSIKPGDIQEVKVLKKPADIIKLVFDLLLILFVRPLNKIVPGMIKASKQEWPFFEPSWDCAKPLMGDSNFLKNLIEFGKTGKDLINEEQVELMIPYIEQEYFTPQGELVFFFSLFDVMSFIF